MATGVETQVQPHPIDIVGVPPLRVLVSGAEGFLGRHLIPRLISRGHSVRAIQRCAEGPGPSRAPQVDWRISDIVDRDALTGLAGECDAVVHLAGVSPSLEPAARLRHTADTLTRLHVTGTRNLVQEARRARVGRFVFVSTLGSSVEPSPFFRSKCRAEEILRRSGLEYVVLRPCVIYGPGDEFTSVMARLLRRLPVFPLPEGGRLRMQPVAVEDIADTLVQSVERRDVAGSTFDLVGPEPVSFARMVQVVAAALGLRRPLIRVPDGLTVPMTWLTRALRVPYPISLDRVHLDDANPSPENELRTVFRIKPLPLEEAVQDYLSVGWRQR